MLASISELLREKGQMVEAGAFADTPITLASCSPNNTSTFRESKGTKHTKTVPRKTVDQASALGGEGYDRWVVRLILINPFTLCVRYLDESELSPFPGGAALTMKWPLPHLGAGEGR